MIKKANSEEKFDVDGTILDKLRLTVVAAHVQSYFVSFTTLIHWNDALCMWVLQDTGKG